MKLSALHNKIKDCRECNFQYGYKSFVCGSVKQKLMLIGQSPPSECDKKTYIPFQKHKKLLGWLKEAGISEEDFRKYFYITSVVKCYPGPSNSGKGDRTPSISEIKLCAELYLRAEIAIIKPIFIITLGSKAAQFFFAKQKLSKIVGKIHNKELNGHKILICPLPHSSGVNYWNNTKENKAKVQLALRQIKQLWKSIHNETTF